MTPDTHSRGEALLLWQQVLALADRYPSIAARIRPAWWERPAERELLRALCAWREALDLAIPQAGKEVERARLEFREKTSSTIATYAQPSQVRT